MKGIHNIYRHAAMLCLLLCCAAGNVWGQVYGDQYEDSYERQTIQHKPAKWHTQRENGNYVDTFDDESKYFSIDGRYIQATHTLVDTIYMHRGEEITLTLPDRLENTNGTINYSIKTYQRWYNFLTDGTFETNNRGPHDLLTPNNNQTGYRLANGYVGSPLTGEDDGNVLSSMTFYYPTETEADNWFASDFDDSYFLVACDVSGYTDYTENYTGSSKNSSFRSTYCEPTLSHRIIYYICPLDNPNNWYTTGISSAIGDKYMEEYNITMPATRIPNYTEEMIALSKDARSFAVPGSRTSAVSVSLGENSAGITLRTNSLSGEERVIHFSYPNQNRDGTYSVTDGSTATILVTKGGYNLARYNLTFEEDFRLLTQTQVEEYNTNAEGTYNDYQFRMPDYLKENYILLNELNFDYDPNVSIQGYQEGVYPFPMNWGYSTYAFYDGGVKRKPDGSQWLLDTPADFEGGHRPYPEWGYYGILSQYVESGGWAWGNSNGKDVPRDDMEIRYNSSGEQSTYHLYADVSDRPGVVARLPFETNLCAGSELYVTAWVKSARGGNIGSNDNNNAAMLFTIMGVTTEADGSEVYTPIYRYQTGQIPVTYSNDKNVSVPGFGVQENGGYRNDWFQVYFSFINSSDLNYDRYVLQIDNNSASTRGGDMYLDDVRVYIARPMAEVTQLQMACTDDRTLMNLRIDWERFCQRVGTSGLDGSGDLGICFVDTLIFHNTYEQTKELKQALDAAVVELGESGDNSRKFRMLHYYNNFDTHETYNTDTPGNHVAAENNYYFYGLTEKDGTQYLSVDFYGDLVPNRAYWVVMVTGDIEADEVSEITDTSIFTYFYTDPCALVADFKVQGDAIIKVNGEIVTPETEFCKGNVHNFTVDLRVPIGDDYVTVSEGIYYDWFFGETNDPLTEYTSENPSYQVSLQEALRVFRNIYPDATSLENVTYGNNVTDDTGTAFTESMYNLIKYYVEDATIPEGAQNRPLVLHQPSLSITLLEALRVVVCPIPTQVPPEGLGLTNEQWKAATICWGYTYLELTTTNEAPTLHAGFNTTRYPKEGYDPALRIGIDQIRTVSASNGNSKTLKIDLRGAQSYDPTKREATLRRVRNRYGYIDEQYAKIYLTASNDPALQSYLSDANYTNLSLPIGEIERLEAHYYEAGTTTATNQMEIQFYLDKQTVDVGDRNFTFNPKEGYTYTFIVHYEEMVDGSEDVGTACIGTFPVVMKVVPEYLVWEDTQKDNDGTLIGNWNNDGNWRRATNGELQKSGNESSYPTEGNTSGFVPMLFSKVIMPRDSKIELYAAGLQQGYNMNQWVSYRPEHIAAPTDSIQYDLMAYDHSKDNLKTEPYRVALCEQIHFEPGAEMLHAEYLLYKNAWVDYELPSGQWNLLALPLQGVVAGDFYTDKSGTEESEYFTEINFSTTDNNRFNPSVYQRGWKAPGATLQTLNHGTKEMAISGNWSSLYNDVDEAYTPGTGFSLKVQDLADGASGQALFRLPKADEEYYYFNYNNGTPAQGTDKSTIDRGQDNEGNSLSGRLMSDEIYHRTETNTSYSGSVEEEHQEITVTLSESANGDYYLVGNPFMAHLNMKAFFETNGETNGILENKYWYVAEDGVQNIVVTDPDEANTTWTTAGEGSVIPPLRSFFVKKKEGVTSNNITFTHEMQVLGSDETSGDNTNTETLVITAKTSDGKVSRAAIAYDMAADKGYASDEDAELFLDSNLSDVPTIYTVAGTMATSINRTSELYNIPVGIYGNSTEMVTLSFEGLKNFGSATLYDAEKRTETPLREGTTLTVPASTSGRYFLRAGAPTASEQIKTSDIQIYTLSDSRVMVTSTTPLKNIRVYTINGALVRQAKSGFCSHELYLPDGIYVITAENANGQARTAKLNVN